MKPGGIDRAGLSRRLLATFLEELEEHVQAINRDVLALERDAEEAARAERVTTLLRTAHSLKGAARAVQVPVIERACHHLESALETVRNTGAPPGSALCSLLLAAADGIEEAGVRLRTGDALDDGRLAALLPQLEDAATPAGPPAPTVAPPAVPPVASPSPAASMPVRGDGVVRVRAERLDALLARTGELLVVRRRVASRPPELAILRELVARCRAECRGAEKAVAAVLDEAREPTPQLRRAVLAGRRTGERLSRVEEDLERLVLAMAADARLLHEAAGALEDDVRRARMLPFAEGCAGLERMVRDLGAASGKDATLVLEGGEVELDRTILEALKDPLRHLVRNAVDHGLEGPVPRRAAGKPEHGTIRVRAAVHGDAVDVVVSDDGRGLDLEAVRECALRKGLVFPPDDRDLARLVFEPGLSTAPLITDLSGRGVGLDVVKTRVEALHGTVDVISGAAGGTRFVLTLPLSVTTLHALLVAVGPQTFAIASAHVGELRRVDAGDARPVQGREMLRVGDTLMPVAGLADSLGLTTGAAPVAGRRVPVVVVAAGEQRAAFLVDELLAEHEVVVKSLGPRLRHVPAVTGATLLPTGDVALVLNVAHLVRRAHGRGTAPPASLLARQATTAKKRILLVDDSITTRSLERGLLEAAGYEVAVAVDGEAAWRLLEEQGADLVVSDVEMPRMDGFALTEAIRASARFRDLPVVLVTGLGRDQDKRRGLEAGANAYLVKSVFDQSSFLDVVAQLT